ncbi:MAG: hypothetical protein ACHQPH_02685 [Reyranellales bacterium]|jgi:hypothetical protein
MHLDQRERRMRQAGPRGVGIEDAITELRRQRLPHATGCILRGW